jgi:hypothetical protein
MSGTTPEKYAYLLVAVSNGRPNGRVGLYKSRRAALEAKQFERQTTRIRRERVPTDLWHSLWG